MLLLGVALAVVSALLATYLYTLAVSREGVVVAARELPFGTTIQLSDLREVALPPDTGLATVLWEHVGSLVGQVADTDIRPGQALTADSVSAERSPAPGEAVVGLSLAPGRVPATPLTAGDGVLVVLGDGGGVSRAVVLQGGELDATGRRSLDVVVAQADAAQLAAAAAEDRVSVALVPRS